MTKPRHIWWLLLMTTHQDSKVTAGETAAIVSLPVIRQGFFMNLVPIALSPGGNRDGGRGIYPY